MAVIGHLTRLTYSQNNDFGHTTVLFHHALWTMELPTTLADLNGKIVVDLPEAPAFPKEMAKTRREAFGDDKPRGEDEWWAMKETLDKARVWDL